MVLLLFGYSTYWDLLLDIVFISFTKDEILRDKFPGNRTMVDIVPYSYSNYHER
jgi:hypothetical protein